jgi:hypothetical protein
VVLFFAYKVMHIGIVSVARTWAGIRRRHSSLVRQTIQERLFRYPLFCRFLLETPIPWPEC